MSEQNHDKMEVQ